MHAPLKEKNDIKIFILYLLKNINYPLDFNTISDIVVQDEFVSYFDFAECFAELLDNEIVEMVHLEPDEAVVRGAGDTREYFKIAEKGIIVVEQLHSNLLNMIKEKSLKSAMRLLSFKKNGSEIKCSHSEREDGKFALHCEIIENRQPIMKLDLVVESREMLERMEANFNEQPEITYRGIISLLTGDINYLID